MHEANGKPLTRKGAGASEFNKEAILSPAIKCPALTHRKLYAIVIETPRRLSNAEECLS